MPAFGETPRTPWGDPDLQGMWVNNSATPLERPDAFQGKETLTDEELQELKKKAAEVLDGGDAFFADDFVTAAVEEGVDFRSFDQKTGNYSPDPIFEYACHEGNLAMEGILKGARAEERKQQK
jgi:hypothetical protein